MKKGLLLILLCAGLFFISYCSDSSTDTGIVYKGCCEFADFMGMGKVSWSVSVGESNVKTNCPVLSGTWTDAPCVVPAGTWMCNAQYNGSYHAEFQTALLDQKALDNNCTSSTSHCKDSTTNACLTLIQKQ